MIDIKRQNIQQGGKETCYVVIKNSIILDFDRVVEVDDIISVHSTLDTAITTLSKIGEVRYVPDEQLENSVVARVGVLDYGKLSEDTFQDIYRCEEVKFIK